MAEGVSRKIATELLGRLRTDRLDVCDIDGTERSYGPGDTPLRATIRIRDARAWSAVVREGSIGLGRGYFEGWWTTDQLPEVLRILIRNFGVFDDVRNRIASVTTPVSDRVRSVLPRAGRRRNREDISSHYDLGNDFFELFLDETMTYSSAIFADRDEPLGVASARKYDRLIDKLGIDRTHTVLEIGTGWGGFALHAAGRTGAQVTSTTISAEQFVEASERVDRAGMSDLITVLDSDWRDLEGRYDRVVSIEMIEAVDWRDYGRFFATIERCLAPDGLVGIQAICVPDRRYERAKNTEDFIRRFVFPGGYLPSIGAINAALAESTRLQLIQLDDFSEHYAVTLRRWRERFDDRIDDVRALGLDERFCQLWRFYLAYCEAAFAERHCTVNQFVLAGHAWRPSGLTVSVRK